MYAHTCILTRVCTYTYIYTYVFSTRGQVSLFCSLGAVASPSRRLRARPGNHCLCCSLLAQVDLRRQWVSKTVEELQTVIYRLTTDVSNQDVRFQAVPYSLAYNGNFKVSRSHLSLGAHPESPETGVGGASVCRALRPLRIRLTLPISVGTLSIYHPHTQRLAYHLVRAPHSCFPDDRS